MAYTIPDAGDGFGSHVQNYIWGIVFGEIHGVKVYLTPGHKFEHNYNNEPGFNERLLDYINLHKHYAPPNNINPHMLPCINDHYGFCNANLDLVLDSESFRKLKICFFENKIDPYDKSFFNVAVHVRRPNSHDNRINGADTPDSYYLQVMNAIRILHTDEKPLKFHIYSQGAPDLFDVYKADDVEFHIDTSIEESYNGLIFGDALITSRSSFSYTAAMLTNGRVYFKSFWHPAYKNWTVYP